MSKGIDININDASIKYYCPAVRNSRDFRLRSLQYYSSRSFTLQTNILDRA